MFAIRFGLLPKIALTSAPEDKQALLEAYVHTYLKEEILIEQLVRALPPYMRFLEIAAQMNGELLSYSAIAEDVGVDAKTVRSYYQILEDTLLGFFVEPFHRSLRKSQLHAPRFYFFDEGVTRALSGSLHLEAQAGNYSFGKAFEHFVINQIYRLNAYRKANYQLAYLRTQAGAEIDLVLSRKGCAAISIEIKSKENVSARDVKQLSTFAGEIGGKAICLSRDPVRRRIAGVECLPWAQGLELIFDGAVYDIR